MTQLSDEAIKVLQEAAASKDGTVVLVDFLDGATLQIAGRNLLEGLDARATARHRSAVGELLRAGLIEDRTGKNELFFVTGPGYDMAEHTQTP